MDPPANAGGTDLTLLRKSTAVLGRNQERFHHLGILEVAAKSVQLNQPEVVTAKVSVWSRIRIAPQVTKVLSQHKRLIELLLSQRRVLGHGPQHLRSCLRTRREIAYQLISLRLRQHKSGILVERVHELPIVHAGIETSEPGPLHKL